MKAVLVLSAVLVARTASADQPSPSTQPPGQAPTQPTGPIAPAPPAPGPTQPAPGPAVPTPTPPADPGETPAPKADPAYGDRPDNAVDTPGANEMAGIRRGRDIVVRYRADRPKKNIVTLALLGGSSVVFGAIGLYFNLEARSASDEVSALKFTGRPWTPERQDRYDEAVRDSTIAGVMYGIGGALLLTTAVYYIVTEPAQEEMVITPNSRRPHALVTPTPGGAFVGGGWSF